MVKVSVNYDLQELCILHCNILSSDIRHSARGIAREILVCDGKISLEAVAAIEQKTSKIQLTGQIRGKKQLTGENERSQVKGN